MSELLKSSCKGVHTSVQEIIKCADCSAVLDSMYYETAAKKLGATGGKKSVAKRFEGKTKEEVSAMMSKASQARFAGKTKEEISAMMSKVRTISNKPKE